jgi:site-specific DNA recombinase
MVRRATRTARSLRRAWANKTELLAGGTDVEALRYNRASGDKKQEGKSVTDQDKENLREIRAHGWREGESYTDNARSASRHARKEREDFERLIEDIEAGRGDVLVVWEISRKERDLAVYVKIRDLCMRVGLNFWLVGGNLYDLRDKNDRMNLGIQAVQAEWLADSIRDNVQRGINLAAEAGRPHGKVTYGYRRIYHQRTKALLRQEPDDEVHEATGLDGTVTTYSHCGVVKEIFKRVAAGDSIVSIEHSLNDRGIPSPQHGESGWLRSIVRKLAINPAYIGKRVLRGEVIGDGNWPALVDEETYWACVRRLEDPSRKTTRPARAVHLLSFIGKCAVCGGPLAAALARRGSWRGWTYRCQRRLCVAVRKEWLDEYIERIVVAWLTKADVHAGLHQPTTDKETAAARAEAQRLRTQLEGYKQLAEAGEIEPQEYARITKGLKAGIAAAEARAVERSLPPVLRGRIGKHAAREWAALADNLPVKREIIREVLSIELLKAESNARTFNPGRVVLAWTYGEPTEPDAPPVRCPPPTCCLGGDAVKVTEPAVVIADLFTELKRGKKHRRVNDGSVGTRRDALNTAPGQRGRAAQGPCPDVGRQAGQRRGAGRGPRRPGRRTAPVGVRTARLPMTGPGVRFGLGLLPAPPRTPLTKQRRVSGEARTPQPATRSISRAPVQSRRAARCVGASTRGVYPAFTRSWVLGIERKGWRARGTGRDILVDGVRVVHEALSLQTSDAEFIYAFPVGVGDRSDIESLDQGDGALATSVQHFIDVAGPHPCMPIDVVVTLRNCFQLHATVIRAFNVAGHRLLVLGPGNNKVCKNLTLEVRRRRSQGKLEVSAIGVRSVRLAA